MFLGLVPHSEKTGSGDLDGRGRRSLHNITECALHSLFEGMNVFRACRLLYSSDLQDHLKQTVSSLAHPHPTSKINIHPSLLKWQEYKNSLSPSIFLLFLFGKSCHLLN